MPTEYMICDCDDNFFYPALFQQMIYVYSFQQLFSLFIALRVFIAVICRHGPYC